MATYISNPAPGEKYYYSNYVRGTKLPKSNKLPGIIISLVLSILICIPICSLVFLTRKKVYKNYDEPNEGIEVNFEAT